MRERGAAVSGTGIEPGSRWDPFGFAAGVLGGLVLLRMLWIWRDPSGLRLASDPRSALLLAVLAVAALAAHRLLPAVARGGIATLATPMALFAVAGFERIGMIGRRPALALVLVAVLATALLAWRLVTRRSGPLQPALAVTALVVAIAGAYAGTIAEAVLTGPPSRASMAVVVLGNERRVVRRVPGGVSVREQVQLPATAVVQVVAGFREKREGAAEPRIDLRIENGDESWTDVLDLSSAGGDDSGYVTRVLNVDSALIGETELSYVFRGVDQGYVSRIEFYDGSAVALGKRYPPSRGHEGSAAVGLGQISAAVESQSEVREAWLLDLPVELQFEGSKVIQHSVSVAIPSFGMSAPITINVLSAPDGKVLTSVLVSSAMGWTPFDLPAVPPGDSISLTATSENGAGVIAVAHREVRVESSDYPLGAFGYRSIVFVSFDTVRADRVGCYGNERQTTPNLDALAARGVRFTNATTTSSWTLPSHASLFTSRNASELMSFPGGAQPFRTPTPLLAEILAASGHETIAFTGGGFMSSFYGFHRGFESYRQSADMVDDTGPNLKAMQHWLETRRDVPFFMLFHTFRAHGPYGGTKFAADLGADASDTDRAKAMYDEGIFEADRALGRLIELLEEHDRLRDTLVVVFSDHGEEFGEHYPETSGNGHGKSLYQEVTRIPIVIAGPGIPEGRVVDQVVSLLDLAPTALDFARLTPPPGYEGRALQPSFAGDTLPVRPILIEQFERDGLDLRAARLVNLKVVAGAVAARIETVAVYDLDVDPDEMNPLPVSACDAASYLVELLQARFRLAVAPTPPEAPPVDVEERLRGLGYLQ